MMTMIVEAKTGDGGLVAALAHRLWPHDNEEDLRILYERLLSATENGAVFLAFDDKRAVGFAQCQLRWDYVEGAESSPVGYLEGIWVEPAFRGQGVAGRLLQKCQEWAKEKDAPNLLPIVKFTIRKVCRFTCKTVFGKPTGSFA